MQRGFHGRTLAALSVGSNKNYKSGIGEVPKKVKFCKFNDSAHLHNLVNAKKTLAIILECIQADGGIYVCSKEFAKSIKTICFLRFRFLGARCFVFFLFRSHRRTSARAFVASALSGVAWAPSGVVLAASGAAPSSLWRLFGVSGGRLGVSGRRFGAPGAVLHLELWWRSGVSLGGRRVVIGVALGGQKR